MKAIPTIIKAIKERVSSEEFRKTHAMKEKAFTRNRKMNIEDIVMFILCNLKSTLPFEIMKYSEKTGKEEVSSSAITQARSKLNSSAFEELLQTANTCINKNKTVKGYQLIAVDGMKGELPKTPELTERYCKENQGSYPQFHAVSAYDILNNYYLNAVFEMQTTDERKAAKTLIETFNNSEKQILVFDRGFPSVSLIKTLNHLGKSYVMRVSSSFLKEVNAFKNTKASDKTEHIAYDKRRGQLSGVKNIDLPYEFDLRMVKVPLKNKQTEILITNLPKETFSKKEIGELYGMRWGIETSFSHLKNCVFVEEFLGKTENSIKQEFFASLIVYNLCMCFVYDTKVMKSVKKN